MRIAQGSTRGAFLCALFGATLIGADGPKGSAAEQPAGPVAAGRARIQRSFGKLPASFIENVGQAPGRVAYYLQSPGRSLYFTQGGHSLRLTQGTGERARAHTIEVELVDAAAGRIESLDRAPGVVSYFRGPKERWKTGIPTHARIGYVKPWPGIDLAFDSHGGKLESIYTVGPHADPARIKLRYSGQDSLALDAGGNLVCATSLGEVTETAPILYQDIGGRRVAVEGRYALLDENTVGFDVGAYDPAHALVIDPTLVYAGFIGGSSDEEGRGIAVDGAGNVYVTGFTASTEAMNFPATVGPDLAYNGGLFDAFVARVNADGATVAWVGYIGGSGRDEGAGITLDSAGNAYVTGWTNSTEAAGFPVTVGPDITANGSDEAFVAKVSADGMTLLYCGYIGGSGAERGFGIAVDGASEAYVTGYTTSTASTFPEAVGPDLTHNGGKDAFVAKVNAGGTGLVYAGYIGGNNTLGTAADEGLGIAVDSAGNAYVTGATKNTEANGFPVTVGPDLTHNGADDAFVAKISADGSTLVYAGYIGGSGDEPNTAGSVQGAGIAVDSAGNAYVTGSTFSSEATFPEVVGPDLTKDGLKDAYVAKVSADGSSLVYAGFIAGNSGARSRAIAVDSAGNAYVAGTLGSGTSFPAAGGLDSTFNGGIDAFVAKVNAAGTVLEYAGYIGGSGDEEAWGIAVDGAGNAYLTGVTSSTASFPTLGGPDLTNNGGKDVFVVKIGAAVPPDTTPDAFSFTGQTGVNPGSTVTSNIVTVSGIDSPAEVTVSGGEYSLDCAGTFTASAGSIGNDRTVCVRHTAPASFSTATDTTLTVGGVSGTFTSTTGVEDTTPDAFTFVDRIGVTPGGLITSSAVIIGGINSLAAISVSGGEYSIDCTGPFTASAGSIGNGQTVCVRHTAPASLRNTTDTTLTVGGVSDIFTSTTGVEDTTPDAFAFVDQAGVAQGIAITSSPVTISGINAAAIVSVSGGEYSIGCAGPFASSAGSIGNGQTVCVRHSSPASFSTATDTTLTVGGVSDTFSSTTGAPGATGAQTDGGDGCGCGGGGSLSSLTLLMLLMTGLGRIPGRARR